MAHVYRAVWTDDLLNVELAAVESFGAWLRGRNTPIPITEGRVETIGDRSVSMVRHTAGGSSGVQIQLMEDLGDARGHWVTTLNCMSVKNKRVVWVDVQAHADGVWQRAIRAPRIVREMLLAGGEPRSGVDILEVQPREIDDDVVLGRLVESLLREERTIPYVVIAGGEGHDRNSAMQRATLASEILAGVAKVALVDAPYLEGFNDLVPRGLALESMGARLCMPGSGQDPENVKLTAFFADDDVADDQMNLGLQVAARIGISSLWPTVPESWSRFKKHLDERRRVVQRDQRPHKIRTQMADTDLDDADLLRQQIEDLQVQLFDATYLAEEEQKTATKYRDLLVTRLLGESETPAFTRPTLAGTIEEVRRLSNWIVIPKSAPREIESLDTYVSSGAWANDLARLCASMERYATHKAGGKFRGNYRNWCTEYGDYSDDKIALNESISTKQDGKLVAMRTFEIDPAVHPSGRILMLNHAKIQAKGSSIIPRVFFHDDTHGPTRKMHIGFIGPHHLVPTSSF